MSHARNHYYQVGVVPTETVMAALSQATPGRFSYFVFEGFLVETGSHRIHTYRKHGCQCRACGRVADRFVAEIGITDMALLKWYFNPLDNPAPKAHLNLYGTDPVTGEEFMMTSDHKRPKSLGGSDSVRNRIPLCERCNQLKGNDPTWLDDLPKDRNGNLVHRKHKQTR